MQVEITINGITRTYNGDYDQMHNVEWNDEVCDLLDKLYSYEQDHAKS